MANHPATHLNAWALRNAILQKRFSARDVMAAHLARIEALNPALNAVCTINPKALDDALAVDQRLARGEPARALEGVPFVVKDNLDTVGLRTTYGALSMRDHIPQADCIAVARLRAAGAVLVGKTNTPEFAADINTSNAIFGQTRNPWNLNTTPGGSSGGTGAAIAAGFAPIGLGTDLGGSIRIPASFNGICGLRPTPGRVAVRANEFAFETLVPHVQGPMARHVEDLALMLSVLSGPHADDPLSLPMPHVNFAQAVRTPKSLSGVRVAMVGDLDGLVPLDDQVRAIVDNASQRLKAQGVHVERVSLTSLDVPAIIAGTRGFNVRARFAPLVARGVEGLSESIRNQVRGSADIDIDDVIGAERMRSAYWKRVSAVLGEHDYLLLPTVGVAAFRLDQPLPETVSGRPVSHFYDVILSTYAFSLLGLPVLAVPAGWTDCNLPVGMQIVASRFEEAALLGFGAAYALANSELFDRVAEFDPHDLAPVHPRFATGGVPIARASESSRNR